MNDRVERALASWLADGPERGSREALERALAATRRVPQRPGWTFPERWLPVQVSIRPVRSVMIPRPVLLLLLVAVLTATLATIAVLALNRAPRLPAPFGPAANGLIAYDRSGQIFLALADGSSARPLALGPGEAFTPTFSPDGTRLAFLSRATPEARIRLMVANADGTAVRGLAPTISIVNERLFHPQWSPDGRRIAVSTMLGAEYRIVIVEVETGAAAILPGSGDDWYPSWSPDGRWILFRRGPTWGGAGVAALTATPASTMLYINARLSPDRSFRLRAVPRAHPFDHRDHRGSAR